MALTEAERRLEAIDRHETERRHVWSNAWAMTANANDCKSPTTATNYADRCLEEYDRRFRPR